MRRKKGSSWAVVRRGLAWSNLRRFRRELAGGALLVAAAAGLVRFGGGLPAEALTVAAGLWLAAGVLLLYRFWAWLFGPVFFYDLLRTTRGGRAFSVRAAYALFLLFVLFLVYMTTAESGDWLEEMLTGRSVAVTKLPELAGTFFAAFMAVQFLVVLLLTPASAAAAIAEEKERRTLEYVLATELHDREIVLGKLGARVAHLVLFVLTGLPVLSVVQFLGGVDPNLVVAGYAGTLVTVVSLGSLSLVNSAYARKVRSAVFLTYLQAAGYFVVSMCCAPFASFGGSLNPLNWVGAGNPFVAIARLEAEVVAGGSLAGAVPAVVRDYALFHLLVAFVCCRLAMRRLREWNREPWPATWRTPEPVVVRPVARAPELAHRHVLPGKPRPRVGAHAMLWKELYAEPGLGADRVGRAVGPIPVLLGLFWLGYLLLGFCLLSLTISSSAEDFGRAFNRLIRSLGTPLAALLWLGIALRAAGTLTSERERQTLDSLLTTPLENRAILFAKWLASVWCVRKAFWVLGPICLVGILTGGLHVLALPLIAAAWLTYAALAANVGLWFSLICRTTLRATIFSLLAFLALAAAPFALWASWESLVRMLRWEQDFPWVFQFHAEHVLPPVSLGLLVFCDADFGPGGWMTGQTVLEALGGVAGYAVLAAILWALIAGRFPLVTGRMPVGKSGRPR
jgi:ABC-type transport system involved in multi-copper enzyme maturation permease subunit